MSVKIMKRAKTKEGKMNVLSSNMGEVQKMTNKVNNSLNSNCFAVLENLVKPEIRIIRMSNKYEKHELENTIKKLNFENNSVNT